MSDNRRPGAPVLLSGGNPQVPKGYGEEPVRAYIAAMPGWKQAVGQSIDDIVSRTVPTVLKAVKWNTPLYGMEENHYFLGYHCFDRYVKVTFMRGAEIDPIPPVGSKQPHVRYFHVHEGDEIDEAQFADWVRQASRLPGEKM
ncbi:DUF1801 domain-containing protein [Pelagibacterium montanilacus]|uniref:DUF1801 domain-containing protein n=1 Tax=Pelagibacterium montanilacus TaxID=2185280 RepID=UPI000F8CE71D|nr:DUF1801 domain-containing protein [Pelagibacterium montanilacus]